MPDLYDAVSNIWRDLEIGLVEMYYAVFLSLKLCLAFKDWETVFGNEGAVIPNSSFMVMVGANAFAGHERDKYCYDKGNGQEARDVIALCPLVAMVESTHII